MDSSGPCIDERLLRLVRSRTGASEMAIASAFSRSASFRSLCSDLKVCARAYRHWSAGESAEERRRASEYAALLENLGEEVRTVLGSRLLSPQTEEFDTYEMREGDVDT
jgi:hypothetical protein